MIPLFTLIIFLCYYPALIEGEERALSFGQTIGDYIEWVPDIPDIPDIRQFSMCTWVRKRYQASWPLVLSYIPHNGWRYSMLLGDDGAYNYVVHTNLRLQSKFSLPDATWFHVCWTWGSNTTAIYLNGEVIGSTSSERRDDRARGVLCPGTSSHLFGGDLYKMNLYSRELDPTEIRALASDMCSAEEERLNADRIIRWESILLEERTGDVTEISTGCSESHFRETIITGEP